MANHTPSNSQQEHSHLTRNIVIVVVLIVAGVLFACSMLWFHPQSSAVPGNRILLNGTITVNSGSYWYLQFIIPSSANQIQVSGSFAASGGSGNDIRVYIMNETSFMNGGFPEWGESFSAYYDSGQLTTANIDVTLPSEGTYYLVFDNIFSNSQKKVDTQANLSYFYIPS